MIKTTTQVPNEPQSGNVQNGPKRVQQSPGKQNIKQTPTEVVQT